LDLIKNTQSAALKRGLFFLGFTAFFLVTVSTTFSETATTTHVSLKQSTLDGKEVSVPRGASIELRNTFSRQVFNLRLLRAVSGRQLLVIENIPPGQTMSMEMSRAGTYSLCYSMDKKSSNSEKCLHIEVIPQWAT